MKILLAPDSFKGSLTSVEVIECIEAAAIKNFPQANIIRVPMADGGEGTVEALVTAANGEYRHAVVKDPLGRPVKAVYSIINGCTAVIEMAQASGITLLSLKEQNPLITTSYGTGQIIRAALDDGIRDFIIGIGGSATNDGGIGALQALGVRFLDKNGDDVGFGGEELLRIADICMDNLDNRIKQSSINVICDVTNPLTGAEGATKIYGPQKGADSDMLKVLEDGMCKYRDVIYDKLKIDVDKIPGAGAAGGLGAALVAFLGGNLKSGIDMMLDIIHFDELLAGVDLVVTGEGKIDGQSIFGKVPVGIAGHCLKKGIKVAVIAGGMGDGADKVYDYGIDSIMTTINSSIALEEAMARSRELLTNAADRMFKFIKMGMEL